MVIMNAVCILFHSINYVFAEAISIRLSQKVADESGVLSVFSRSLYPW